MQWYGGYFIVSTELESRTGFFGFCFTLTKFNPHNLNLISTSFNQQNNLNSKELRHFPSKTLLPYYKC